MIKDAVVLRIDMNDTLLIEQCLERKKTFLQILYEKDKSPLVRHNKMYQCTYVKSGEGKIKINNEIIELHKGILIVLLPKVQHAFMSNNGILELIHWYIPHFYEDDRELLSDDFRF